MANKSYIGILKTIVWSMLLFILAVYPVQAQPLPNVEVAVQLTSLNNSSISVDTGIGGRTSVYFHRYFALEGEGSVYYTSLSPKRTGRMVYGNLGLKSSIRRQHGGAFILLKPGVIRLSHSGSVVRTHFTFELGAGLELYPTSHALIRYDIADVLIRNSRNTSLNSRPILSSNSSHNMRVSISAGFRF